ncbi:MAG: hypothetical protein ABSA17_09090 [Rhabdochlamydiaceae bacterium]|jgi:hypothetical protein
MEAISSETLPESSTLEKYQSTVTADPGFKFSYEDMKVTTEKSLSERVQWVRDDDEKRFSEWIIDSDVKVHAPSDRFRKLQAERWSMIKDDALKQEEEWGILTKICKIFRERPSAAAAKEVAAWNISPVEKVAKQRALAYLQGFSYVYQNNLKMDGKGHGVLHPIEVQAMYEKYFPNFCAILLGETAFVPSERKNWLNTFFTVNPFSTKIMEYGLSQIPDQLKDLSEEFKRLSVIYNRSTMTGNDLMDAEIITREFIQSYKLEREGLLQHSLDPQKSDLINQAIDTRIDNAKKQLAAYKTWYDRVLKNDETSKEQVIKYGVDYLKTKTVYFMARELLERADQVWKSLKS